MSSKTKEGAYINSEGRRERVCALCGRGLSQGHSAMGLSAVVDAAKKHGIPLKAPDTIMLNGKCAAKIQARINKKVTS